MGKQQNRATGNQGESMAAEYLEQKGYQVIVRNYRSKWGEIDIIAKIDKRIVFVEVKTKTSGIYGEPWEMINAWKIDQVKKMGEAWCREFGWEGAIRMDVVGVWLNESEPKIEHWESVEI